MPATIFPYHNEADQIKLVLYNVYQVKLKYYFLEINVICDLPIFAL